MNIPQHCPYCNDELQEDKLPAGHDAKTYLFSCRSNKSGYHKYILALTKDNISSNIEYHREYFYFTLKSFKFEISIDHFSNKTFLYSWEEEFPKEVCSFDQIINIGPDTIEKCKKIISLI